jgi:hypothetical protein
MKAALIAALIAGLAPAALSAQGQKPQIELTPSPASATVAAGGKGRVSLRVKLPKDVHVQSDKPDDPSLIATVLTVTPAPGISVDRIVYPEAARFQQAGRGKPLAVFGPELVIDVHVSVSPGTPAGRVTLPAQLRYQACNEQVCFTPSRAPVAWAIDVASR